MEGDGLFFFLKFKKKIMAKVFLSLKISVKTTSNKEKINKLNYNNIPFEEDSGEIYLISKTVYNSGADVGSREYDKPYAAFCMRLADSTESSIGMGEGSLDAEELAVLYEVFGDALEFQLTLSCHSDWENISANVTFNEVENKYYCYSEVTGSSDEEDDYDEDYDEELGEEESLAEQEDQSPPPKIDITSEMSIEIDKIQEVCREINIQDIHWKEWGNFFIGKGYSVEVKLFTMIIIKLPDFNFVVDNKENDGVPEEAHFYEGKFAGWVESK